MTPRQIYFINLAKKKQAASDTLDELNVEQMKEKILELQREVNSLQTKIAYMKRLEVLRRKAVVEFKLAYDVAYSKAERALTKMLTDMTTPN